MRPHLLKVPVDVLRQLSEQHPEQGGQQRSRQIQPLCSKVIAIVEFSTSEGGEEQSVYHVTEEESLLRVLTLRHRHVRKHLFLKNFGGVVDSAVSRERSDGTTSSDKIESNLRETHAWWDRNSKGERARGRDTTGIERERSVQ